MNLKINQKKKSQNCDENNFINLISQLLISSLDKKI